MKGVYRHKLSTMFLLLALVITLVCGLLVGSLMRQLRKGDIASKRIASASLARYVDTSFTTILRSQESFRSSDALSAWAESKDLNHFYFNSIALLKELQKRISPISSISFDLAVTGTMADGTTVTKQGTTSREAYFRDETHLDKEQQQCISRLVAEQIPTPVLLPVYQDGRLSELSIATTYGYAVPRTVIITRIDMDSIIPEEEEMRYAIGSDAQILVTGLQGDESFSEACKQLDKSPYLAQGNRFIAIYPISGTSWNLYIAMALPPYWAFTLTTVLCILGIFSICFLALKKMADKLYQPIKEVLPAADGGDGNIDEFALIKENGKKMERLSRELEDLMQDKQAGDTRRRDFQALQGMAEPDERAYTVITLHYDMDEEKLMPLRVEGATRQDASLRYLRYNDELDVIIAQDDGSDLTQKVNSLLGDSSAQAALSDPVYGAQHLGQAFRQARHIMEYRLTNPQKRILTSADVGTFDQNSYSYPLSVEKEFLQAMTLGTDQVEFAIQEIMESNHHLAGPAFQGLVYAVSSTIQRALQELKTTTKELYGTQMNWATVYQESSRPETLDSLFVCARNIAKVVKQRGASDNDKMLALMRTYIQHHYCEDIGLQDLANQFNITAKYCGKLFSQLSNDTFKNYLNQYRVDRAKEILEQNPMTHIVDLAQKMGFNSSTSFIRVFNRYVGMSPKAYADSVATKQKEP